MGHGAPGGLGLEFFFLHEEMLGRSPGPAESHASQEGCEQLIGNSCSQVEVSLNPIECLAKGKQIVKKVIKSEEIALISSAQIR